MVPSKGSSFGSLCPMYILVYIVEVSIFWGGWCWWILRYLFQADSPPPSQHDSIRNDQMSQHYRLRHLSIVSKNLPSLTSLFFYCAETLPALDSLLPGEACWWNQKGLASHCREFCFRNVSNYYLGLAWASKWWRVRHLQTLRSFVAQRGEWPQFESLFLGTLISFSCS